MGFLKDPSGQQGTPKTFAVSAFWIWLINCSEYLTRMTRTVKNMYEALKVKNQISDGNLPFPTEDHRNDSGMSFEIRYVYPVRLCHIGVANMRIQ